MSDIELPDGWSVASCFEEATPARLGERYGIYVGDDGSISHASPMPYTNTWRDDSIVWCVRTAEKWSERPLPDTVEECEPEWYTDQMGRRFTVVWNHRAGSYSFISSHELANGGGLRGKVTPVRIRRSEPDAAPAKDGHHGAKVSREKDPDPGALDRFDEKKRAWWKSHLTDSSWQEWQRAVEEMKPWPPESLLAEDTPFNEVGTWIDHYGDFFVIHDGELFEYLEDSNKEHGKRGKWLATGSHVDDEGFRDYVSKLRRYYYDAVEQPEALERHGRMREAWKRKFGGGK